MTASDGLIVCMLDSPSRQKPLGKSVTKSKVLALCTVLVSSLLGWSRVEGSEPCPLRSRAGGKKCHTPPLHVGSGARSCEHLGAGGSLRSVAAGTGPTAGLGSVGSGV